MALDDKTVKIVLDERDLPTHWYNIVPDLPNPPSPPLHPGTERDPLSRSKPTRTCRCFTRCATISG